MKHGTCLGSLCLLLLLAQCREKEVNPVTVPVGFLPEATIAPSARTLPRGDTLWLDLNFSDSLLDRHNGRRYRVRPQDVALQSYISIQRLTGVGNLPVGIAPSFRFVERVGRAAAQGTTTASLQPVYDGSRYRARIGLVPTQAGVTAIVVRLVPTDSRGEGRFLPFIQLPPDAEGREQKAVLGLSFYDINGGKANNFDLFAQHTRAFATDPGAGPETILYEQHSTFTVEVK
ncbi:hypothetical protein Q3A66_16510 [Hymenobacter sp. BT770]|uniref:hypothetical protein n=1 Tax=Hymenobacter sp. BT770 TaxID=2886942 RepID=UPI001D0F76C7|nr:hypothetical protein [Hymenobacter sp. BT770]MCC3154619.1 hypothetical protein [Hymenobacter sp. BT770]MDO3416673.1 hypothetical protein [Hymenobacter sp. BT770]